MEDLALVWPDKGRELFDQLLALLGGNESGRLNRINEQLNFCKLENPHIKKVAILCTSLAVNIHSERNQIVYVARYSLSGDAIAILREILDDVPYGSWVLNVSVLPQIL
jgi:hypothetical protein